MPKTFRQKRTCGSSEAGRGNVSAPAAAVDRRNKVARSTETRMGTTVPPPPLPLVGSYQSVLKRVNQIACAVVLATSCAICSGGCVPAPDTSSGLVIALESDPQSLDP